ncbi:hypothetical protein ACVPOW_12610 [Staphylococcus aureus]
MLGVIWRENIYHMLIYEEDAIPFNALYASDKDAVPFIENWIKQDPKLGQSNFQP